MIIYAVVSPTMGYSGFYKFQDDAYSHLEFINSRFLEMYNSGNRGNARHDYIVEPIEVREEYRR